ncbi:2OG-Fe dioxygenase family protein [Nocardia cyriacigeorgica]|uniref:Uncharacterized protein conserved in bacteria n=1 Tax=Nocardia cyriacigeorgica TaxID=135487 RepID=A0A4V6IBV0_9NOCA|nr:2OG-Fe dioxygenase family protein [Nocardia cyriacigeorgica]VFA97213.1 Uncharacterized protein conserved in bacteria [Nocardia cyriacigeorgica]
MNDAVRPLDDAARTPSTPASGAVSTARAALISEGAYLIPAAVTRTLLGGDDDEWNAFRAQWDALAVDRYAAERGTRRLRRYGHFLLDATSGELMPQPPEPFVQPQRSNPLYVGVDRAFEPLTGDFVAHPVFAAVVGVLADVASALEDPPAWHVKVHPFRVVASAAVHGLAAPEGRHRDGVTLVSSLLIDRHNALGGAGTVFAPDGTVLLSATLDQPGDLLLGDDRRTLHDVSPLHPARPEHPAYRDVLVTTFAPE